MNLLSHAHFVVYVILMMMGMLAMIGKRNLIKKVIGMAIFQAAIILFFISLSAKSGGADIPILHGGHGHLETPDLDKMVNPLPHVLMLTAIVVGVSTLGVALAIVQRIFKDYGSLEENEILERNDG